MRWKTVRLFALIGIVAAIARADAPANARLLVWIPQTDEHTAAALKILDHHPNLRVVWAISPRFLRAAKDAPLREQLKQWDQQGRIRLALQIPNAPLLPLVYNTDDARGAIPADRTMPTPPYVGHDDVMLHIEHAKADMARVWGMMPKGLVLPYGAVSPALADMLSHESFSWIIAASSSPAISVWDERDEKGIRGTKVLETWGKELERGTGTAVLPEEAPTLLAWDVNALPRRTWSQPDWSAWIGLPAQNALWGALRVTRTAIEAYQNSGQASVPRLDAATEEFLTAENSAFFIAAGSATLSDVEREERARDFEATLGNVYRLIGQNPPDDLLQSASNDALRAAHAPQTTVTEESLADGRGDHVRIADADMALDVTASSDTLVFIVSLGSAPAGGSVDIYADINGLAGVGTRVALPGRGVSVRPQDAWEYALNVTSTTATLYHAQGGDAFIETGNYSATAGVQNYSVAVPRADMRGNARRWGYRALALDKDQHAVHAVERAY